jgi:hypothetical protein
LGEAGQKLNFGITLEKHKIVGRSARKFKIFGRRERKLEIISRRKNLKSLA